MFAGLISFPIFTKNLTPEDYGLVGLFTVTTSLIASFGKLGIQHSILRFREEIEQSVFISNLIFLSIIGPSTICIALITFVLTWHSFSSIEFANIDIIVIAILVAYVEQIRALILNLFLSQQKSTLVATLNVVSKFTNVCMTISAVLLIAATSQSFIQAVLIAELILFVTSITVAYRLKVFSGTQIGKVNSEVYRPIIQFGIPLLGLEMISMLHAFLDRYLIKVYMDDKFLGFYSAYYNMAKIISTLVIGGIVLAIVPAYMKLWNSHGQKKTEQMMSKAANLFLFAYPILVVGLLVVSKALFDVLTTPAYAMFSYLLPIIAAGVFLNSATPVFSAGLKLSKQVSIMFWCVVISTIINLTLNIIFIPIYGLTAAAISTTISYSFVIISFFIFSAKTLTLTLDIYLLMRSCLYAVVFFYLSNLIVIEQPMLQLTAYITLGLGYFTVICMLFEKELTANIVQAFFSGKKISSNKINAKL